MTITLAGKNFEVRKEYGPAITRAFEDMKAKKGEAEALKSIEKQYELFWSKQEGFEEYKKPTTRQLHEVMDEVDADYQKAAECEDGIIGIHTGFKTLDDTLDGLNNGCLYLLCARPGVGKTTLMLNLVTNMSVYAHRSSLFISAEMSQKQLYSRLVAGMAAINSKHIRRGRMTDAETSSYIDAQITLSDAPIYVLDKSSPTITDIRKAYEEHPEVEVVLIDYLQILSPEGKKGGSEYERVTEISNSLREFAKEIDKPVVVASQLSRATEQRESKVPQLSDIRSSGQIEQDAAVVMALYKPSREEQLKEANLTKFQDRLSAFEAKHDVNNLDPKKSDIYKKLKSAADEEVKRASFYKVMPEGFLPAELIILKNRFGELKTIELEFLPEFTLFRELQ